MTGENDLEVYARYRELAREEIRGDHVRGAFERRIREASADVAIKRRALKDALARRDALVIEAIEQRHYSWNWTCAAAGFSTRGTIQHILVNGVAGERRQAAASE